MFYFVTILFFTLFWIFILMQLTDYIFTVNKKIKVQALSFSFISISFILAFIASTISFYLLLNFLFKLPIYLGFQKPPHTIHIVLSQSDCSTLAQAIKQTESKIHEETNHRFLEETAHLFTIKLEYQKVAEQLQEQAQVYNNLELSADAETYAQQISTNLQEQSELFIQRNKITPNKEGIKKVYKLLNKMDKLDQERLRLVNQVKQQCNNTA